MSWPSADAYDATSSALSSTRSPVTAMTSGARPRMVLDDPFEKPTRRVRPDVKIRDLSDGQSVELRRQIGNRRVHFSHDELLGTEVAGDQQRANDGQNDASGDAPAKKRESEDRAHQHADRRSDTDQRQHELRVPERADHQQAECRVRVERPATPARERGDRQRRVECERDHHEDGVREQTVRQHADSEPTGREVKPNARRDDHWFHARKLTALVMAALGPKADWSRPATRLLPGRYRVGGAVGCS